MHKIYIKLLCKERDPKMPTLSLYNNISADQLLSQENGKNIQDTICYKNIPMIRKPDYKVEKSFLQNEW